VETRLWPTVDHLDPPYLPRYGCNSDRDPAASGGPTVLANDRNGVRFRLNTSRHEDDDDADVREVLGVQRRQSHRRSGLATLPSAGANPSHPILMYRARQKSKPPGKFYKLSLEL